MHGNQKKEICKLNVIIIIHSSFTLIRLVIMCHVWVHVIKYNFNPINYSVHGQFLNLKTNFDIIQSLYVFLVFKLNKISFKNYLQSLTFLQVKLRLIF